MAKKSKQPSATELRRRLEAAVAPGLVSVDAEVKELIHDSIELLCSAYAKGGYAEAKRTLRRIRLMTHRSKTTPAQD